MLLKGYVEIALRAHRTNVFDPLHYLALLEGLVRVLERKRGWASTCS